MKRMESIEEFKNFRERILKERDLEEEEKPCLVVCAGTGGQASGSNSVLRIVKRIILERKLQDQISLRITGCQGFCQMDPFIVVEPGRHLYPRLRMDDVPRIIEATLAGEVIEELLYRDPVGQCVCLSQEEIPFFQKQTRTILGKNHDIDPIRILDYLRNGGYAAFQKVLPNPDPRWIIEEVKRSGLRGRGGAGFPTGRKWELARNSGDGSVKKYVVCNADEGDPGAYMDRSLLEGNPHAILEGMLIAGVAIGASKGVIYVRTEYPLAIKHTLIALRQARELGILGPKILGTDFDFNIEIVRGAGAFVCGEETALIRSIEGRMGEPRQRPPYPIERGIGGHPTCINNVETLANIPVIISQGAEAYAKVGIPGNTGTKIFSLVGKIKNTGLVEVPLGTTIGQVVYDIGGGAVGKTKIKAVQTGGPSGGCIPASRFDLSIDYDSLSQAGTIMGSGGMIVMDENTCMVDVARYFMNFLKDESCGKCFTCRKGTQRMYEILDDITKGKASLSHLSLLEELAHVVKDTTLCGLGHGAPNPVLSTLRYFRKEYERHIVQKRCDAFVCRDLVGAPCQSACPLGTEAWRYVAHIERGEFDEAYRVIREANPFPSVCARVCTHPCEEKCRAGTNGGQPVAIRALKRFITDRIDPGVYRPEIRNRPGAETLKVAVVGAGPAGLTAAHSLSLRGYKVTLFEAEAEAGGMLLQAIPAYRLPRDVLRREIRSLLNENVTLRLSTALGRDFNVDRLFEEGFKAVFLSTGAHMSRRLNLQGEDSLGVLLAMPFLKMANVEGTAMAKGRVAVIGGGNAAIDTARVALRQEWVTSVTLIYRRTREEMPALAEEIEAALQEGVALETLSSPIRIQTHEGRLAGIECIRNKLGDRDETGRRSPLPIPGTEYTFPADTLIVAVGEEPEGKAMVAMGIAPDEGNTVKVNPETFCTNREGVFAGGDLATGPKTVVDAIAAGKNAAVMIDRYLAGEVLSEPAVVRLPKFYVEPIRPDSAGSSSSQRAEPPELPVGSRGKNFEEVEMTLAQEEAVREARRCLRCDLDFTLPKKEEKEIPLTEREARA